ncbi:MoaD/ThiS family protein [Chryseobacterium sp. EO14]|uniref:sulfur carrier protein ThiS n=1 Tax=Chryseobacterium sp. EO14 TaxID=2950551 RepID=UPI00210F1552
MQQSYKFYLFSPTFDTDPVALNNRIIPQLFWAETFLNDKDSVLIITATQGG